MIDTAAKRLTIAPMIPGGPRALFVPDGTIDAGDRVAIMGLYSGSFDGGEPEPPASSIEQPYFLVSVGQLMNN